MEEVVDGLLYYIFDFCMEVISWFVNNGKDINIYFNELEKYIVVNFQLVFYFIFVDIISEVFVVYYSIVFNLLGVILKEDVDKVIWDI